MYFYCQFKALHVYINQATGEEKGRKEEAADPKLPRRLLTD